MTRPAGRGAVKARYVGVCRGCGAYAQPRNGKGDAYAYCKAGHPGAIERRWTHERVLVAMRAWRELHGRLPSSYDWSRIHARRHGWCSGATGCRGNGRRRASSRTSSDRGRPPTRRRRGRTWRRRQLRPDATTFANRAGCPALSTVGTILPPGFRFDIDAANGRLRPGSPAPRRIRRRSCPREDARPPSRRSSVTRRSLRRACPSDGGEVLPCPCRVRPVR